MKALKHVSSSEIPPETSQLGENKLTVMAQNHLALSTDHVLRTGYFDHTDDIPDTEEKKIAKAKKRFLDVATIQGM